MLVFITAVKHPDNSQSYEKVWQMLNNTLFSVCSQKDKDFRVVVVCDKKLPLYHHAELINRFTEFVEVDFPRHGDEVIHRFNSLGNFSVPVEASRVWEHSRLKRKPKSNNQKIIRIMEILLYKGPSNIYAKLRKMRRVTRKLISKNEFKLMANYAINRGTKQLIGVIAAKKYTPEYVMAFDADDYVGNDISAYANSHPGKNGWIMAHGYKMTGNRIAPYYMQYSFCGTGNIFNYSLLSEDIPPTVDEKSTQEELIKHVSSELILVLARHVMVKPYYEKKGKKILEYPSRSVVQLLGHEESNEYLRSTIRGEATFVRLNKAAKYADLLPISSKLVGYFNILPSASTRVFCLGLQKTGTTSVESVLQDMGYQTSKHYKALDHEFHMSLNRGKFSELRRISELFDAFQDTPWFLFYEEFDKWYPGSKFILTIRDSSSWWLSFLNYFRDQSVSSNEFVYGYGNPIGHEKEIVARYERYNRDVIEYFKDRSEDLLIIDVSDKKALEKISNFLGKASSYTKMPHKNARLLISEKEGGHNRSIKLKRIRKIKRRHIISAMKTLTFSSPPIVIGGSQGSGAELILSILSCHPNIHTVSGDVKLNYPTRHPLLPIRTVKSHRINTNKKVPINLQELRIKLYREPIPFSSKRWCGLSSLSVLAYERLLTYYGKGIQIINIVRDGRDVVTEEDKKIMARYLTTAEQWVYDIKAGIKFENHPQVLTLRYEDSIQNYEDTINMICEFIGEEDKTPFLNYPVGATIIQDSYWIGRWQQPEFVGRIDELLKTPSAEICLEHYGYLVKKKH
ncbi:MAG: hypothetical protein HN392_03265 [Anaerolineae bacterium]|jgi:hypothetical protein|nr:hypothetical protein [Anaerolineae bacterium]MBT7074708.1 hypothetical protein [Anaerolineae bacterium]